MDSNGLRQINNSISESYCSFEVSKLLKERGFDIACAHWYNSAGVKIQNMVEVDAYDVTITITDILNKRPHTIEYKDCCFIPTHALAIEWIRVNFGLWVHVFEMQGVWYLGTNCNDDNGNDIYLESFNSPQEATEAALLYTLKNLIQ